MTIYLLLSKYDIVISTCVITTVFSYYFITSFLFTKNTNKKDTKTMTSREKTEHNKFFSYESGDSLIFLSPDTNFINNIPKQEYNYHIDNDENDENYVFVTAVTNFSKESAVILASKSAV